MAKAKTVTQTRTRTRPTQIVVADRGFVYVGQVELAADWVVVHQARNIRYWGTTRGLGQLAMEGPTATTRLDPVGTVRIPSRAVISLIDTEAALWTTES